MFVGTGNCTTAEGWGDAPEALLALDLDTGDRVWTYQPHEQNLDDLDFAGAPNLFEIDGRAVVGLGNKDATYYVVDRETGDPVWQTKVAEPGVAEEGENFSFGGFIGPTAYVDGMVVGGTAVGGSPYLHALDAETGDILWQQGEAGPTFAAALEVNGVVFLGGTDYTLRAVDLQTGDVLVAGDAGAVSGGPWPPATTSWRWPACGSGLFRAQPPGCTASRWPTPTTDTSATTAPATTGTCGTQRPFDPAALAQPCVAAPCPSTSRSPRSGSVARWAPAPCTSPPTRSASSSTPRAWATRTGGCDRAAAAADAGASVFAVFMSQGTDNPVGGLACVLDENFDCTSDEIPNPAPPRPGQHPGRRRPRSSHPSPRGSTGWPPPTPRGPAPPRGG